MFKKITVLFDLDGTLIDSNEIIIQSYQHAFSVFKPELDLSREQIISFIGPTLESVFLRFVDQKNIPLMIETYRTYYTKHEKAYHSLYPNVKESLDALKRMDVKLCIVTSKFKEAAWPSFLHYGLNQYFDGFIALEDVKNPKPDKEPVLKALSLMGDYDYALMIGDNHGDILAGKNAGIDGAGVAWSIQGKAHLEKVQPDFIFESMNEIVSYIESIKEN